MNASLRFLLFLLSVFMMSCTSRPAPISANNIPGTIFPALCKAFLREEGFDSSTTTVVLSKTRPVFNTFALRVLHSAGALTPEEADKDIARDDSLRASFRAVNVDLPVRSENCSWVAPGERFDEEYLGSQDLILELSNIVEDPFAASQDNRLGIFARLSFGGASGASWYWVALRPAQGRPAVSSVSKLEISDG